MPVFCYDGLNRDLVLVRSRHPIRLYDIDGKKLPSVTSVLARTDHIFDPSKTSSLEWWRNKEPNHANILKEACRRGSIIHSEIELALKGTQSVEYTIEEWKELGIPDYMTNLLGLIHRVNGCEVEVEKVVRHSAGYAGTADLICELDGEITILDWKTTRHHREVGEKEKKRSQYKNAEMQIAAYAAAYNQQEKPDRPITRGVVAVAYSWREPQLIELDQDMLASRISQFAERLSAFKALESGS